MEKIMAQNGISRRGPGSGAAPHDPVPMIDQCVAILALALFLSLLGSFTFAAERERRSSVARAHRTSSGIAANSCRMPIA
jgi:hypothetical protein